MARWAITHLAADGLLEVRPGKSERVVLLKRGETILALDLASRRWRDRRTKTNGSGLYSAMRRLRVPLETFTAALVAASQGDR